VPGQSGYGWDNLVQMENNSNSIIENNVFVTATSDDQFAHVPTGIGAGIVEDYNLYAGPGAWSSGGNRIDFTAWKAAEPTWDQHSMVGDAKLGDLGEFSQTVMQKLVYDWSKATPQAASPLLGAGTAIQQVTNDFTGAKRPSGTLDVGALAKH
jgi:hypothetical protein